MSETKKLFAEKVLAKRNYGKEIKYLIKWHGQPIDKATWKEEKYLKNISSLIEEFEKNSIYSGEFDGRQSDNDSSDSVKKQKKQAKIKRNNLTESYKKDSIIKKDRKKEKKPTYKEKSSEKDLSSPEHDIPHKECTEKYEYSPDLTMDIPEKVLTVKIYEKSLCCLVSWRLRPNGIVPEPSYVLSEFLKEKFPNPLIEFYESKIHFFNKKKN